MTDVRVLLQGCDFKPAIALRPLVFRRQASLIGRYKVSLSKLHVYRTHVTNLLTAYFQDTKFAFGIEQSAV
jgi:hypothetical protein